MGEWKEGKEHGTGKRIFEEDHYYYGDWKEGEREGELSLIPPYHLAKVIVLLLKQ